MEATETTTEAQNIQAAAFWQGIFRDASGYLEVWSGFRKNGEIPSYTNRQEFFHYPDEVKKAEEWAYARGAEGREVYFCARLLTARKRSKDDPKEVNCLYADLDGAEIPNGRLTPTFVVQSSPGRYHCYWLLTNSIPRDIAEQLNKRLTQEIGADPSGADLAQILRVPGTVNHKYEDTPTVWALEASDTVYLPRELDETLPELKEPEEEGSGDTEGEPPVALGPGALQVWRGERPTTKATGKVDRSRTLVNIGRQLYDAGASRRTVIDALRERDLALGYRKYSDRRDSEERYADIFEELKENGRGAQFVIESPENEHNDKKKKQPKVKDGAPTHDELRDRWIGGNPDYAYGLEEWRHYERGAWIEVKAPVVKQGMVRVLEAAKEEGIKPSVFVLNSVHALAQVESYIADERWDSEPDYIVCENCAVDTRTGEAAPHRREHFATSRVPCHFDPSATAPNWQRFIRRIEERDADTVGFLQEFAGYALTLETALEKALWLVGPPGGGKSTFIEGLLAVLGHRAGTLGLREIERSRFALGKLIGKTLVTAAEQPVGFVACHDVINAIISGEEIQVEQKWKDPYDYRPRAKILWAMNELPRIPSGAEGLFRRIEVVRFPALPEGEKDPTLKEGIKLEGAGILNWALEGLVRLRARGDFEVPEAVAAETQEFRENNDIPAAFVEERCDVGANVWVKSSELYSAYKEWCLENNHKPKASNTIIEDWRRLGFEKKKKPGGSFWLGVDLKEQARYRDGGEVAF